MGAGTLDTYVYMAFEGCKAGLRAVDTDLQGDFSYNHRRAYCNMLVIRIVGK